MLLSFFFCLFFWPALFPICRSSTSTPICCVCVCVCVCECVCGRHFLPDVSRSSSKHLREPGRLSFGTLFLFSLSLSLSGSLVFHRRRTRIVTVGSTSTSSSWPGDESSTRKKKRISLFVCLFSFFHRNPRTRTFPAPPESFRLAIGVVVPVGAASGTPSPVAAVR